MNNLLCRSIILLFLSFVFLLPGRAQQTLAYQNLMLQTGDLIFVGAKSDQLSGAINRVTQREENASFDHVGILEVSDETVFVCNQCFKSNSR